MERSTRWPEKLSVGQRQSLGARYFIRRVVTHLMIDGICCDSSVILDDVVAP